VADLVQRLAHAVQQQPARHRQLHAAPLAAEQRLAQLLLQLRNLVAHGGLGNAQLLCRARVIAQAGCGLEADQEPEGGEAGIGHGTRQTKRWNRNCRRTQPKPGAMAGRCRCNTWLLS